MAKGASSALDAQNKLFECLDISCTVRRIEARHRNSGRGRRGTLLGMLSLMHMYLLRIPTVTMLSTMLARYEEYAGLCGFNGKMPDRTTFSKFITRAKPQTVEDAFRNLGFKP
jgi:hypothetical protein